MDGVCQNGILRVDIISTFEEEQIFTEVLKMATENLYIDFDIKNIVIQAGKADLTRVLALKNNGFNKYEEKGIIKYNDYYFKRKD